MTPPLTSVGQKDSASSRSEIGPFQTFANEEECSEVEMTDPAVADTEIV
jgi:hypothetical protein